MERVLWADQQQRIRATVEVRGSRTRLVLEMRKPTLQERQHAERAVTAMAMALWSWMVECEQTKQLRC